MSFSMFLQGYRQAAKYYEHPDDDKVDWMKLPFDTNLRFFMLDNAEEFWMKAEGWFPDNLSEKAGQDFWLSHNGTGAGFFDDPDVWGEHTDALDELAQTFPEVDMYREGGRIYGFVPFTYLLTFNYAMDSEVQSMVLRADLPIPDSAKADVVACRLTGHAYFSLENPSRLEGISYFDYSRLKMRYPHMNVTEFVNEWRNL